MSLGDAICTYFIFSGLMKPLFAGYNCYRLGLTGLFCRLVYLMCWFHVGGEVKLRDVERKKCRTPTPASPVWKCFLDQKDYYSWQWLSRDLNLLSKVSNLIKMSGVWNKSIDNISFAQFEDVLQRCLIVTLIGHHCF